jgi:hypothetical protein
VQVIYGDTRLGTGLVILAKKKRPTLRPDVSLKSSSLKDQRE